MPRAPKQFSKSQIESILGASPMMGGFIAMGGGSQASMALRTLIRGIMTNSKLFGGGSIGRALGPKEGLKMMKGVLPFGEEAINPMTGGSFLSPKSLLKEMAEEGLGGEMLENPKFVEFLEKRLLGRILTETKKPTSPETIDLIKALSDPLTPLGDF